MFADTRVLLTNAGSNPVALIDIGHDDGRRPDYLWLREGIPPPSGSGEVRFRPIRLPLSIPTGAAPLLAGAQFALSDDGRDVAHLTLPSQDRVTWTFVFSDGSSQTLEEPWSDNMAGCED